MALGIIQKHNLDPRQVFVTALTIDGMNASRVLIIETRRKKLQQDLTTLFVNVCRDLKVPEKQPEWYKLSKNEDILQLKNCPGSLVDQDSIYKWNGRQVDDWEKGFSSIIFVKPSPNA